MAIGRSNNNEIPFPQADDPFKVIGVVSLIAGCNAVDDDKIAATFNMVGRQGAYYGNAAAYLGYIVDRGGYWKLTNKGDTFAKLTRQQQEKEIADNIIALPVFDGACEYVAIMGTLPKATETAEIIQKEDSRVNDTTALRRAKTVNAWIELVRKTCPKTIQDIQAAINAA